MTRKRTEPSTDKRVATAIRFPPELHRRLHEEAEARELSANFLVVKAVEEFLDRLIPSEEFRLTRDQSS